MTLIVSIDVGAAGTITVDGHLISEGAAVNLAANGFVDMLRSLPTRADLDDARSTTGDAGDPTTAS